MANGIPNLYDLRVTLASPRYGVYGVRYELLERVPYPPPPHVEGDVISFAGDARILETAQAEVSAHLLDALVLPSELGDISGLFDLALLETMREQWSWETVAGQMEGAADHLFQGGGRAMLQRLLEQATPPEDTIYGPPPGPWTVGRITLDIESPELRRVPWEMMTSPRPEWGELWRRCIVLRRSRAPAGERSGPFDIPVTVAIRMATDEVQPETGWGDNLFDGFTHHARYLGGIEWSEMLHRPESTEVHHVVYSSFEGLAPMLTALGYRPTRRRLRGGRALSAGPIQPRLLILHDVSAYIAPFLTIQVVYEALSRGADAVLLAAFDGPDPNAGDFFPTFYRKLMHNWPLDHCLLAALTAATQNGTLPQGWAFGAREGGELRLLLTGAVVEAAQAVPRAAEPPAPPARPGRVTRGRRPTPAPPGGAPPPAMAPAPGRPVPPAPPGKQVGHAGAIIPPMAPTPGGPVPPTARHARAAADLETRVRQVVDDQRRAMVGDIEKMASVSFEAEAAGVAEVVSARERMREASRTVERGEEALETLTRAEDRTVHSATVRLTNLWLTEGDSGEGRAVTANEALFSHELYTLHLQIGPRVAEALAAEVFPDEALREVFERHEKVQLDVMLFSPETDFELERRRATLELPRYGASNEVRVWIKPQEPGQRRLRVCIYYRNVLLQSVLLEAAVVERGAEVPAAAIVARTVDYVASTDLALLEELPQPALNIFTNQTSDGTHWIGVFSADDPSSAVSDRQLRSGDMHSFGADELAEMARQTRELLAEIEGKRAYRFTASFPLDEQKLERREKDLVKLAVRGWRLYHALFLSREGGLEMDRLRNLHETLQQPGIVSIARCRGERTTIPWAALYDLALDTGKADQITLCEIFKAQLAANKWSDDMAELTEQHDYLDDPQTCRSDPQCPLKGANRKLTVCPFGFWGFLHQVEQPLQQVKPTPVDEVPEELQSPKFNQTSLLMRRRDDEVHIAIGAYPGIPDADEHHAEIEALSPGDLLDVVYEEDRDRVLMLLEQGGRHLYYFYCHGEMEGSLFKLKLGPSDRPRYISADNLDPFEIDWPDEPQPLVILNGCETMALTPELIHGFLGTLRRLGASGVVGSEVKVWTQLARPFGRQLLKQLLESRSVGEAFLEARRHLLRQYNPLGLVYTYYAPATLHLHDPADCDWCQTHSATPVPGNSG